MESDKTNQLVLLICIVHSVGLFLILTITGCEMRGALLLIIILSGSYILPAQQRGQRPISTSTYKAPTKQNTLRIAAELCNNNTDDDANGLKDCDDYDCYFSSNTACNCKPIDVIWIGDAYGNLVWINHQTGVEKIVGNMGRSMTDITWSPNGNLYGVDASENKIWKIDPATAQTTFVSTIPGYDFSNALTADGAGNLYLASVLPFPNNTSFHIIRLTLSTGIVTPIADLTVSGLLSAGDLAFHNGTLYLACDNNILANINVATGSVGSNLILGLPAGARIFGIVIKSDGTIYLSGVNKLYKLNVANMQASLYYTCVTPGMNIWGMGGFNDYCLAQICNARVAISILTNQPYCSVPGVQLKAEGTGLNGTGTYKWTLPNGTNLSTQTITATQSGTYVVRYATVPDTCGWQETVNLQIAKVPNARLGVDTVLCTGTSITLVPTDTTGIISYTWQDGSRNVQLQIDHPGLYWLQTANSCGTYRDSVLVTKMELPIIRLGPVSELCKDDTLYIKNLLDEPGYTYRWSDNTIEKFMVVPAPGKLWVDVSNMCGVASDSIIITAKVDGCDCKLYVPTAFTPNNDGKNDLLKAFPGCPITGELSIYDRWGQLVYYTKDLQKGWDGTYNKVLQSSGLFVYHIKYAYTSQPGTFYKKGSFMLIR